MILSSFKTKTETEISRLLSTNQLQTSRANLDFYCPYSLVGLPLRLTVNFSSSHFHLHSKQLQWSERAGEERIRTRIHLEIILFHSNWPLLFHSSNTMELSVPHGCVVHTSSSCCSSQLLKPRFHLVPTPNQINHPLVSINQQYKFYPMEVQRTKKTSCSASSLLNDHGSPITADPPVDTVRDRIGSVKRVTNETNVFVELNLDGVGSPDSSTGIPFLDHMLDQLASHGLFDVHVKAVGDTHIDDHHTNEDVALAIGTALLGALGDRKGINRFGDFTAPLDEALVHVTLDLSGRPHLNYDLHIPTERVGTYDTQLVEHFFQSLVNTSGMTLHIRQLAGKNSHHIIEATFKAFARALRQATEYDPRRRGTVPSSKGVLSRS
ncbi:hypothetical protein L6452_08914 [Arctium lappa]|uniref:Uncharacterized protein n=1 Tax=Arctium lappa TaxID=4217 RepID=A0ACB9DJ18_ARCLA|nr:hypothetical protein L6452_08914 [Arctium lappa]